jgi:pimeloyl-ACP methyl ester carboxylesterase
MPITPSWLKRAADQARGAGRNLIVFVPGFRRKVADYTRFLDRLKGESGAPFGQSDFLALDYPNSWYANGDPTVISQEIETKIEEAHQERRYQEVYLVGHSLGGLLLRRAVLEGRALNRTDPTKGCWTHALRRIVLLASGNRGYVVRPLRYRLALPVCELLRLVRLARSVLRESPWINNLRLGWIEEFGPSGGPPFEIVQVRGNMDEEVGADDSMDLYCFNAREFVLNGVRHKEFCEAPGKWYGATRDAFHVPLKSLPARQLDKTTRRIVFLIHGIRDFADWQENLEYEIHRCDLHAKRSRRYTKVISVRYGYFNILQFLLPTLRRRCVRSFADLYIQELAKTPGVQEVCVAAHSNGTYAFAHALQEYGDIRVKRAYLAGSVLPRDFPWATLHRQLGEVRNDCANWDWPVGALCNGLHWWYLWRELGTGGFRGFAPCAAPAIQNNQYLEGDHGAAFQPQFHAEVAEYLINGVPCRLTQPACGRPVMITLHRLSYLLVPAALGLLGIIYWWIATAVPSPWDVFVSAGVALLLGWILLWW